MRLSPWLEMLALAVRIPERVIVNLGYLSLSFVGKGPYRWQTGLLYWGTWVLAFTATYAVTGNIFHVLNTLSFLHWPLFIVCYLAASWLSMRFRFLAEDTEGRALYDSGIVVTIAILLSAYQA